MKMNRFSLVLTIINLALLAFILVRGSVLSAPVATNVLRANRIELVGNNGQVRVRLNIEEDGTVVFRMMDEEGTIRVKLGASEEGSGLVLLNNLTEPGIHLLADRNGTWMKVTGQDGNERVLEP